MSENKAAIYVTRRKMQEKRSYGDTTQRPSPASLRDANNNEKDQFFIKKQYIIN